jgi:hypothetical protein
MICCCAVSEALGPSHLLERPPHARFIIRMHFLEMRELALGDLVRNALHRLRHVLEQPLLLSGGRTD